MSENNGMAQFNGQQYLNLETFRKSGAGVKTPVWFVEEGGKFYVRTAANSGKVKRLRRSPQVRVAPCQANGEVTGTWVAAEAVEIADLEGQKHANRLMNRKYGFMKRMFDLASVLSRHKMTAIEIRLPAGQ